MPSKLPGPVPVRTASRRARLPRAGTALALALVLIGAGCGPTIEERSFDASVPCTSVDQEGRFKGAYPELEGSLPPAYEGRQPTFVDSGRSCTAEQLGTLGEAGISEIHFAGSNWDLGSGQALTVAAFDAPGLDPAKMVDFYEAGARAANRTNDLRRSDAQVGELPAQRLDVLYGETRQTIVAWPARAGGEPGRVFVLLAADIGDTRVLEVLESLADGTFDDAPPSASPATGRAAEQPPDRVLGLAA